MLRRRVVVADDHPHILQRVSEILASDYEVVAAVHDGQAAVDAATALHPDVVVLDVSMPTLNGFEAAAQLGACASAPRIIFLTVHEGHDFVEAARNVGASAYVLKRAVAADLLPTIRLALDGAFVFPPLSDEPISLFDRA